MHASDPDLSTPDLDAFTTGQAAAKLRRGIEPGAVLRNLWAFARPHTIIGTTLAVLMFYTLAAAATGQHDWLLLLATYVPCMAVNLYVVGFNQLTDVEIDRINKPYLPIASGEMSMREGRLVVAVSGLLCLVLSALQGPYLFGTVLLIFLIGGAYSVPGLRLKTRPFWAAASITVARALVLNLGLYLHYTAQMTGRPALPAHVILFALFMFVFCIVIAIMKDIPDIQGDRQHDVPTLVGRLGARKTLALCHGTLALLYAGMVLVAIVGIRGIEPMVLGVSQVLALGALLGLAIRVDASDSASVYRHYMFVWKLFYLQFLVFPMASLLA